MDFARLEDADLKGKTAIVRVDFNVPRADDGSITDDTRLLSALPTIQHLKDAGTKIVLLSHFGRPKGAPDPELSLKFIVPSLARALGDDIYFSTDINKAAIDAMPAGHVMLLGEHTFSRRRDQG